MTIRRRLAITLAFIVAGAFGGAATATSSFLPVWLGLTGLPRNFFSGIVPLVAAFGVPFGIVVMPLLGWILVGRVPFWRAALLLPIGAIIGTNALALMMSSLQTDVLISGALVGALAATLFLRLSGPRVMMPDAT